MSYDINVVRSKNKSRVILKYNHGIHGGTYAVGGTNEAWLNITYNYAKWFYELWPEPEEKEHKDDVTPCGQMFGHRDGGIRSLYGRPLDEVIHELDRALSLLHGEPDSDYWAATEGNARDALFKLKLICEMARYENPGEALELKGD